MNATSRPDATCCATAASFHAPRATTELVVLADALRVPHLLLAVARRRRARRSTCGGSSSQWSSRYSSGQGASKVKVRYSAASRAPRRPGAQRRPAGPASSGDGEVAACCRPGSRSKPDLGARRHRRMVAAPGERHVDDGVEDPPAVGAGQLRPCARRGRCRHPGADGPGGPRRCISARVPVVAQRELHHADAEDRATGLAGRQELEPAGRRRGTGRRRGCPAG